MRKFLVLVGATVAAACAAPKREGGSQAQPASAQQAPGGAVAPTQRTPEELKRDAELEKRATAVVEAYQNRIFGFGGILTYDHEGLVFGSNREGSPQLYLGGLAAPAAPPRRLS